MISPLATPLPTIVVDAELRGRSALAQLVRYDIPGPTESTLHDPERYTINFCLTPRPLNARACYREHWGPHRFERLGDIFLIPPGEALYIKGDGGRQASLLCYIEREAVNAVLGRDIAWSGQQLVATTDLTSARVRALLRRMAEEVGHPGFAADQLLDFLAGQLAIELARFCLEVNEAPVTGGLAGWRLRLIDERLAEAPTGPSLAELAELCSVSVRQLTRGFKVSRGCSLGDYIQSRRMETAKRMLVAGETVKTIAFALGFASPSSFTFAFRRAVGISPSQFRQRQTRGLR